MGKTTKLTQEEFLDRCRKIHGDRYDYSKTIYKNQQSKVIIICYKHGEFEQLPYAHLNHQGCSKCVRLNKPTIDEFINKSNKIHNNKYNYSKVNYINTKKKIIIICLEHGEFLQSPDAHLSGQGCSKFSGKIIDNTEDFIKKSQNIHDYFYQYYLTKYVSTHSKVNIVCPKHGKFTQSPANHLKGKGCPKCRQSKGEMKIYNYLIENNIKFDNQKTFNECRDIRVLKFDFYLTEYNICIEYDGEQHFQKCWFDKNDTKLIIRQKRDLIKTTFCKKNNINLIRITYKDNIEEKLQWLTNYLKTILKKLI